LRPGYKLNELDVSKELRISRPPLREAFRLLESDHLVVNIPRPPLREAFRLLESDHLVVNIPRKGTYVAELSVDDFLHTAQVREMIESFAIDILKSSNIKHIPKSKSALDNGLSFTPPQKSGERQAFLKYIDKFIEFHREMIKATGNNILASIYDSISSNLARYQFIYFFSEGTAQHSLQDHSIILESIAQGDYEQAKEYVRGHLNYIVNLVKSRILDRFLF